MIFGVYITHIVPDFVVIIAGSLDFVIFTALLFIAYRRNEQFPCIKWYVTEENKGPNTVDWNQQKLVGKSYMFEGQFVGTAWRQGKYIPTPWRFRASDNPNYRTAVSGPILRDPLQKGKYRALFKLKFNKDEKTKENQPIINIDVSSSFKTEADKRLAGRTLFKNDFDNMLDAYHDFILDFTIKVNEPKLELRITPRGSSHIVTLDYIKLSRRWF